MSEAELCLATWNLHMGVGRDGRRDLERTARVILEMRPDLIGLQEVDNHFHHAGDDLEQLRRATGLTAVPGPALQREVGDYGNALLTRLPVLDVERHDLSVDRREPRGLLIVHLDWQGEILQVAVTHLGLLPGERRSQVRNLIDCLARGERAPLILMGDFNEWLFWGRPMRWLHRHFGRFRSPATFPVRWPFLHLDHILAEPRERLHSRRVHRTELSVMASDHLPLTARFVKRPD